MGIWIGIQPMIAFGFAFHFMIPAIELTVGPLLVIFGDISAIKELNDDD